MRPILLLTVLFAAALAAETRPKGKIVMNKKPELKEQAKASKDAKTTTTANVPKNNRKRSYVSPPARSPRPTYGQAPPQTQYQQSQQQYQQPAAPAPQYQPAAPAPQYQPAAPAPQYQPAAPAPQYQPAAPVSQYQPAQQYQQSNSYGSSQAPAISSSYSSVGSSGNGYGSSQGQYGSSYSSSANVVPITSFRQTIKGAQENTYSFETGNGIKQQESTIVRPGYGNAPSTLIKSGSVQYTSPDGSPVSLSWVADENGFQPNGAHLPVAPDAGNGAGGSGGYGSSGSYSSPAAPSGYGQQSSGGYSSSAAPAYSAPAAPAYSAPAAPAYSAPATPAYSAPAAPSSYGQTQSQPQSYAAPAAGSGWGQSQSQPQQSYSGASRGY